MSKQTTKKKRKHNACWLKLKLKVAVAVVLTEVGVTLVAAVVAVVMAVAVVIAVVVDRTEVVAVIALAVTVDPVVAEDSFLVLSSWFKVLSGPACSLPLCSLILPASPERSRRVTRATEQLLNFRCVAHLYSLYHPEQSRRMNRINKMKMIPQTTPVNLFRLFVGSFSNFHNI
jgi:hypothetical protein